MTIETQRRRPRWQPFVWAGAIVAAIVALQGHELAQYAAITIGLLAGTVVGARDGTSAALERQGFARKGAGRDLALGFAIGTVTFAAVVGLMAAAGWYEVTGVRGASFVATLAYMTAFFFFVGVLEEFVSRRLILGSLERKLGSWWALILSSALFGLLHIFNPNASFIAAVGIMVAAGLLLGSAYLLTRTLWMAIGIHWAWNLFEGPVFGTPVSGMNGRGLLIARVRGPEIWTGGPFGPEAGLACLIVGGLSGGILLWLAVRRGQMRPRGAAAVVSTQPSRAIDK